MFKKEKIEAQTENASVTQKQTDTRYGGIVVSLLVSLLLLLVGLFMTFLPSMKLPYFCYIAGGFFLCWGVAMIVRYFVKEEYRHVNNYDFSEGILGAIVGLIVIVRAEEIGEHFMTGLGILILIMSVIMLQHSIQMMKTDSSLGNVVCIISIFLTVYSALILLDIQNPITRNLNIFYISLIICGLLGMLSQIIVGIRLVQVQKRNEKALKDTNLTDQSWDETEKQIETSDDMKDSSEEEIKD